MLNISRGCFLVGYPGLGDALMAYPVLQALAKSERFSGAVLAYPENQIFHHLKSSGLPTLPSTVTFFPPRLHAFNPSDWEAIRALIEKFGIGTLINLQNEGPRYDKSYYRFRESHKDYDYWELDFRRIYEENSNEHILESTRAMIESQGVPWWYPPRPRIADVKRENIVFYVGTSESNKRWGTDRWTAAITRLAQRHPNEKLIVLSGISEGERADMQLLKSQLGGLENVSVNLNFNMEDKIARFSKARLIVSHDSYPIHLASLLGIPVVGVYLSTNPRVWGSYENNFRWVFSGIDCGGRKPGTGNCIHFHSGCPNIEEIRNSVTVDKLMDEVTRLLKIC